MLPAAALVMVMLPNVFPKKDLSTKVFFLDKSSPSVTALTTLRESTVRLVKNFTMTEVGLQDMLTTSNVKSVTAITEPLNVSSIQFHLRCQIKRQAESAQDAVTLLESIVRDVNLSFTWIPQTTHVVPVTVTPMDHSLDSVMETPVNVPVNRGL